MYALNMNISFLLDHHTLDKGFFFLSKLPLKNGG